MNRKLKEFVHGGSTIDSGIDMDYLVGWLEAIIHDEEENCLNFRGPKADRLEKAQSALELLHEVSGNTG